MHTHRSANAFAFRGTHRGKDGLGADRREDLIEAGGELGVAVTNEEAHRRPASWRSAQKLRATWVTQGPLGLVVTPRRWTTRRSTSITYST